MNPQKTEVIQIPKCHFQSMITRLQGVKNVIRMYVAKDNELKTWMSKYEELNAKYSQMQELITQERANLSMDYTMKSASYSHLLPPVSYIKIKEVGVSNETYLNTLKNFAQANYRLNLVQKNKPLKIEFWTQTEETGTEEKSFDIAEIEEKQLELESLKKTNEEYSKQIKNAQRIAEENAKKFQAQLKREKELHEKTKEQQLELESLKKTNEEYSKQIKNERTAKRFAEENAKKFQAQLKREKELHEKTKEKFQGKCLPPVQNYQQQRCSPAFNTESLQQCLEVDCGNEDPLPPRKCDKCQWVGSTDDEFEEHKKCCSKPSPNSKK